MQPTPNKKGNENLPKTPKIVKNLIVQICPEYVKEHGPIETVQKYLKSMRTEVEIIEV